MLYRMDETGLNGTFFLNFIFYFALGLRCAAFFSLSLLSIMDLMFSVGNTFQIEIHRLQQPQQQRKKRVEKFNML